VRTTTWPRIPLARNFAFKAKPGPAQRDRSRPWNIAHKKSRPSLAGSRLSGWRGSHDPRRQSRISAYLADGDVGCRATGAPTSSRARVEACGSHRSRADLGSRHTFDRGASCATPSREVMLRGSVISRLWLEARALGPEANTRGRRPSLVATQRFGTGPRSLRGNTDPRVAIGGPIHARLTPGNSALRVRFMPCTGSRSTTRQLCGPLTPIRAQTSRRLALLSLGCASLPARQASTSRQAWLIWLTKG